MKVNAKKTCQKNFKKSFVLQAIVYPKRFEADEIKDFEASRPKRSRVRVMLKSRRIMTGTVSVTTTLFFL